MKILEFVVAESLSILRKTDVVLEQSKYKNLTRHESVLYHKLST